MKTKHILAALALVVGCTPLPKLDESSSGSDDSSDYGSSNVSPSSAQSTALDTNLDALFHGSATADQTDAGARLVSTLSGADLEHLQQIDWSTVSTSALLADPVVIAAMAAVEPASKSQLHTASITVLGAGSVVPRTEYSCDADCGSCQSALADAISALQRKIQTSAVVGAATCIALAPTAIGGVACGGIIAYILDKQVLALANLSLCMAGGGGTLVQTMGDPGSVTALNASCAPPTEPPLTTPTTPTGPTCNGAPTDLATSDANCGACGNACPAGATCSQGACCTTTTCNAGLPCCGGTTCTDVSAADGGAPANPVYACR